GTNVRQVWLEVQVQRALSLAQHGQCSAAVKIVDHLAEPVSDLAFTHDGLEPFLRSARMKYLLGNVYKRCNIAEKAQAILTATAEKSSFDDAVWAWKASQQLSNADSMAAKKKLEEILEQAENSGESSSPSGWWLYNVGLLNSTLGNTQESENRFRHALLASDSLMAYHLTRLAMSGGTP
ncbi:MAG TPA: hypothetical protein VMU05_16310, partial [Dongiaceae bacterium]|nr:hypothetical protein [Dongiaceae bacterium]